MDRENDIFDNPSKVQNMNFLFDDEAEAASTSIDETQTFPAARRTRHTASNGSSVQRGRRVESSGTSQRQRAAQSPARKEQAGQQIRSAAARSTQGPSQARASRPSSATRTNASNEPKVQSVQPNDDDLFATDEIFGNIRKAEPVKADDARTPKNVSARSNNRTSAKTPTKAQPRQVRSENTQKPRKAQPRQAEPRKAQPRNTHDRQLRSATIRENGTTHTQRTANAGRVNRPAPQRTSGRGGRGGKKGTSFKKFLLIYSAALLAILIIGMIIFASFLGKLEKSQPSRIAETVAENLTASKASSYLKDNSEYINCFGEPDDLIAQFATGVEGVESLSYIENSDYRADAPSYNITADGKTVAKLTLAQDGKGSFGLSKWKIASLDIADYMDTASYEFLAPVGTTITIDGVELDDKYLTGEESIPQTLEGASKYVTIPSYITYKVAGIAGTPEIKATDPNGTELTVTAAGTKYVVGSATDQTFIDSVKGLVDRALEAWGKHFINMGGNLSAYMLEGSDWYSYIFGGPDMDPIYTAFYEYESIANYTFTEKNIDNFIRYTNDCFTVDVSYKMQVDFNTDRMSDNNQKLDATWVFITQNGGQDWYLIDCIYK